MEGTTHDVGTGKCSPGGCHVADTTCVRTYDVHVTCCLLLIGTYMAVSKVSKLLSPDAPSPPPRNPFSHLPDRFRIKWEKGSGSRLLLLGSMLVPRCSAPVWSPPCSCGGGAQWLRPVIVLCPQPPVVVNSLSPSAKPPWRTRCSVRAVLTNGHGLK